MPRAILSALAVGAIGVALAASGCGGDGAKPADRSPGRDLRDLEKTTKDQATRAQIERFARIRIPASATNLRSFSRSAMDTQLLVSFRLPRADLDAFLRAGDFSGELVDGYRAIVSSVGSEIGWRHADAKRIQGLVEIQKGLGRNLLVVLDEPQRPAVYLEAATL